MQKKDLQSHMIKLHGAPKPHAVSAKQGWGSCGPWTAQPCPHLDPLPLPVSPFCSAPLVPSASCLGRSYSCTKLLSIVEKSSLCVRNVGTGPQAAMGCRCTSRPSTGINECLLSLVWPCYLRKRHHLLLLPLLLSLCLPSVHKCSSSVPI